ncbi:hypothetical protein OOK31_13155 [Streptomyces sp. NBC_00249]|uniref:DUF6716 putative glycosyltransferase n=1 Tax=Streptomyces sp. NBC_00249 TaxID=2975690 RepID=UPI00224CF26F|nr:DUF6716 putative glycosyltransferase [Streptomyces sp. NBC_00249]MCX5194835.1 hypothetical protein [Streptomyces sp. NBC_00249]
MRNSFCRVPVPLSSSRADLRIAVLADSDTRWKWGALTARRLAPDTGPHQVTGYLLRGRATPTARQLGEVGAGGATEVTCADFLAELRRERYDVVVLALVGGAVQAVLHGVRALWPEPAARPVLVTGYVGVVYEKLADGLLLRHGADLVLANSRHDAERFRAVYEGVGAAAAAVTETALPFLDGAPYESAGGRAHRVVFAVQPSVPESRADRTYLLARAAGHARLHQDREVLVKLRSRPGEHTTHLEEHPYQRLADRLPGGLPPNCRLVYGNMGEVLDTADLLVTVSSTAALESLHRGIPTAVLTDLGIRETLGNHHFLGSGCLTSWDHLDTGHLPTPSPRWLATQGVRPATPTSRGAHPPRPGPPAGTAPAASTATPPGDPAAAPPYAAHDAHDAHAAARARLDELLAAGQLPPVDPYYTLATAPGYLPGILARQHLAPDGTPLPGAVRRGAGESAARRWLRAHLREAARGAYRHGVQRVAPAIRRLGEL